MPSKDPLKIVGQPKPTEQERARVTAFAEATGRPPKFCRAALIEAKWDDAEARRLIDDPQFVRLNTDFDFAAMTELSANPAAFMAYMTRQQMLHAGNSEAEIEAATQEQQAQARVYEKEEAEWEARERAYHEKTRGATTDDPVFGPLKFDEYAWAGVTDLPPFGNDLELTVEPPELATELVYPTDRQREAFVRFRDTAAEMHARAEAASYDYYNEIKSDFRQFHREDADELVPELHHSADIWRLLKGPPNVLVGCDADGGPIRIILGYGCTWDVEHGHCVKFEDGEVVEVGHF